MIKMIRLDERMIHGQVAIKWSRHIGVDRIIVANDDAAANPIIQKSLMMAAPTTAKVAIKSVVDSITLLKDPRANDLKILVIVSNPEDLLKVLEEVNNVPLINIGNYGRIAKKQGEALRKTYGSNLYAYDFEVEVFKKILSYKIDTVYQTTPEDSPEKLEKVLAL
ncbi:PTS system mannose/fructose/N-acetylgalactosamine-transporter subunit IIB [Anaerorhabdus sp.]|uniref:PTS system mannose/fructose/N-acetylgalactosamine-transporter subunit IIB n=1 Tax=Anaerorhabdus sp. TaxID=1872524 RepID=UPI002FC86FB8